MEIVDRIHLFIKFKSLSLSEFDRSIGVGNGYIGKQLRHRASIGSHIIEKIINSHPELNVRWLMTGEGEMLDKYNDEDNEISSTIETDSSELYVYNIDSEAIKSIVKVLESPENSIPMDSSLHVKTKAIVYNPEQSGSVYLCLKYMGKSMVPLISSGTIILAKQVEPKHWGNIEDSHTIIVNSKKNLLLGTFNKLNDNIWILSRSNSNKEKYPNLHIKVDTIDAMWIVIGYLFTSLPGISQSNSVLEPITIIERRIKNLTNDINKLKEQIGL